MPHRCVLHLRREDFENRVAERLSRVAEALAGCLPTFTAVVDDTAAAKARRRPRTQCTAHTVHLPSVHC